VQTERRGLLTFLVLTAAMSVGVVSRGPATAAPPEAARPGRGPIVNQAADAMFVCLVPPFRIDGTNSKQRLIAAYENLVDRYADARVPYLFLNVNYQRTAYRSQVWDAYWDNDHPESLSEWPRLAWLVYKQGVDPYAVCVRRCRQKGVSPWISIRMNDTHYHDDPMKTSTLWQNHPELRRAPADQWYCGFDFAHKQVRDHYLALVEELLDRYDCDGLELDWMRFPHHFKAGQEQQGCRYLNDFMRRTRALANEATARRGHPVRIAARIPAVPEFARGLGMDGVAWAREGWVDMLILASEWRPSDTDIPIERWRELIGPAVEKVLLVAGTDLWLEGTPGGKLMADDLETQCGFTAAMLDRGADLIYLFNHFNMGDFHRTDKTPDGRTIVRDENRALLSSAGRLQAALKQPRRHVITFHDPAAPHMPNPRQLPAQLAPDRTATFRIYTGPRPTSGRVILRAGLDNLPGVSEAGLSAGLNGVACTPIEDLALPAAREPTPHDRLRVFHVADVARRMLQFEVPLGAVQRGQNTVQVSLRKGSRQKIIWLEVYIVPRRIP